MKRNILIVDDDVLLRQELAAVLRDHQMWVTTAGCGQEAISVPDQQEQDVVLVDIRLPDDEGLNLVCHLKKKWPDAVYLVMTAYGSMENVIRALRCGVLDYVMKPFQIEELLQTIERAFAVRDKNAVRDNKFRRWFFERDLLVKKIDLLRRLNDIYVEREDEILQLKREVNELLGDMHRDVRYRECVND